MITFNWKYFSIAILLFIVEVIIALYVHDKFIRPYIGDLLVVVLIYCFIKSFVNLSVLTAALIVLLFSFVVEILQYFQLVKMLGLENSNLAKVVLGSSFSWFDLLSYFGGFVLILIIEKYIYSKRLNVK